MGLSNIDQAILVSTILLLLILTLGIVRTLRGPTLEDRMLSVQMLGTGGVALLLLLSALTDPPALLDVALVLALLAPIVAVAVSRRGTKHG